MRAFHFIVNDGGVVEMIFAGRVLEFARRSDSDAGWLSLEDSRVALGRQT